VAGTKTPRCLFLYPHSFSWRGIDSFQLGSDALREINRRWSNLYCCCISNVSLLFTAKYINNKAMFKNIERQDKNNKAKGAIYRRNIQKKPIHVINQNSNKNTTQWLPPKSIKTNHQNQRQYKKINDKPPHYFIDQS